MADGMEKLVRDLDILQAMVEELANYLDSEAIFLPMFMEVFSLIPVSDFSTQNHEFNHQRYSLVWRQS